MSQIIDQIFTRYHKIFLNREEEIKTLLLNYFKNFIENHILENVERIEATERLKNFGFYKDLSAWRNSYKEIIVSSCQFVKEIQKRFDYKFIFKGEQLDKGFEEEDEEKSVVQKGFREFTDEEKEQYRQQKEQEKKEIEENFQNFLEVQTLKNVIDLIDDFNEIPSFQQETTSEESLTQDNIEEDKEFEVPEQVHGYSIRNYLMVLSQARKRQDETFIGVINSYWNWKKQGASVLKNPDKSKPYSYKILVPIEKNGVIKGFKLGSVFDISQTNKYEEYLQLKNEKKEIIWQDEIDYTQAIEFVKTKFSDIQLIEDFKDNDLKGTYDLESKNINIYQKNSHTVFHELGKHISLFELKVSEDIESDSMREEILAEVTCYLLMKKFEKAEEYKINYNFGYSNCWALNILDEFKFREFEEIYAKISDYVKNL